METSSLITSFFVPSKPQPGGSKRAFFNKKTKHAQIVDANPNVQDWKYDVKLYASKNYQGKPIAELPLFVLCNFYVLRPKYHYGTGKNAGVLKPQYVSARPTSKPDTTKLFRSTEDALTGIVWKDDAQVVDQSVHKYFGDEQGAWIAVHEAVECPF